MKKIGTLLCAVALCSATTSLLAQDKPAAKKDEKPVAKKEEKPAAAQQTGTLGVAATVKGGTIGTASIVASAVVAKGGGTVAYKDAKGADKKLEIKAGDTIEKLQISGATISAGVASGGTLHWPEFISVNLARGTVTAVQLTDTVLQGTTLTSVTIASGAQTFKHNGTEVTVDPSALSLDLAQVHAGKVTVANPEIAVTALVGSAAPPQGKHMTSLAGDYLQLNANIPGFAVRSPQAVVGTLTAPKGSCFRVSHELEKPDPADGKPVKYLRGTFATGWAKAPWPLGPFSCPSDDQMNNVDVNLAVSYDVLRDTVTTSDVNRFGWTYGLLVAPFKYYRNQRELSAGATVGPYLGYRVSDRPGGSIILAAAIGAATANVKTRNPDGSETSTQKNGLSMAVALLADIKDDFNVGFIAGRDYFSYADSIPSSATMWVAVSFGKKLD